VEGESNERTCETTKKNKSQEKDSDEKIVTGQSNIMFEVEVQE